MPPTVTIRLQGGLGNQMFQYAAAKAYVRRTERTLVLDASWFAATAHAADAGKTDDTTRALELAFFRLDGEAITTAPASSRLQRWRQKATVGSRAAQVFGVCSHRETAFHWQPIPELQGPEVFLKGYFQSPLYFADSADALRNDFFQPRAPEAVTARWQATLASIPQPVAVHIRRGDFERPHNARVHGVLGLEYYHRALALMQAVVPGMTPVYVSDMPTHPDVAALQTAYPGMVLENDATAAAGLDMMLMRRCAGFVLANSSYSWWAAFLRDDPAAPVIAPRQWFAPETLRQKPPVDLWPAEWILL